MTKKSKSETKSDLDRLRSIAFWFWEYQRRNPYYIHYCNVIESYHEYFENIGISEYINSPEYFEEMFSYYYSDDPSINASNNPLINRLTKEQGQEAGKAFFKYGFLAEGFRKRFLRIYKHYSEGMDTDVVLKQALDCEQSLTCLNKLKRTFSSRSLDDISALLRSNSHWSVRIDDDDPNFYLYDLEKSGPITIDPNTIKNTPKKIGQEAYVINLLSKLTESFVSKKQPDIEALDATYELCIKGSNILMKEFTRIPLLWMWDRARKDNYSNPLNFDDVYQMVVSIVELADYQEDIWKQLINEKSRIKSYYKKLCLVIENMNPLCNSRNNKTLPSMKEILTL